MTTVITSRDERESLELDVEVSPDANRLVLADVDGREFHFGSGPWARPGRFAHIATYTTEGREPYAWWSDVIEGAERGWAMRAEPELGPRVTPLVEAGLASLARSCNQVNGFYAEPEKKWAVERLRALWSEAREPLDPDEIMVWAATHGWGLKHAKALGEITAGVREDRRFRGSGGRLIRRDRERERAMVRHWREEAGRASGLTAPLE